MDAPQFHIQFNKIRKVCKVKIKKNLTKNSARILLEEKTAKSVFLKLFMFLGDIKISNLGSAMFQEYNKHFSLIFFKLN